MNRVAIVCISLFAAALTACSSSSSPAGEGAAEVSEDQQELRSGQSISCTPVDPDEACFDSGVDFCVEKLVIAYAGTKAASLTIERSSYSQGTPLPVVKHALSESFTHKTKKLSGAWDEGDTWIDASRSSAAAPFLGSAAVEEDFGFLVECRVVGAPVLPLYVRTGKLGAACNVNNAAGQKVRCVAGLRCNGADGEEIALTENKTGSCQQKP